jgi:hypothetical protein
MKTNKLILCLDTTILLLITAFLLNSESQGSGSLSLLYFLVIGWLFNDTVSMVNMQRQ